MSYLLEVYGMRRALHTEAPTETVAMLTSENPM